MLQNILAPIFVINGFYLVQMLACSCIAFARGPSHSWGCGEVGKAVFRPENTHCDFASACSHPLRP